MALETIVWILLKTNEGDLNSLTVVNIKIFTQTYEIHCLSDSIIKIFLRTPNMMCLWIVNTLFFSPKNQFFKGFWIITSNFVISLGENFLKPCSKCILACISIGTPRKIKSLKTFAMKEGFLGRRFPKTLSCYVSVYQYPYPRKYTIFKIFCLEFAILLQFSVNYFI